MNNIFKGVFANRKVLITGHTGFKGSWLSLWLQDMGAATIGYSLEPPTKPSFFETCKIADKMTSLHGDIRDIKNLRDVIFKYKPEIIFHLAAQSLVRRSYKEPLETYETNVMGTVNLLEVCRHAPSVKVIINVTSDKCYENKELIRGYKEDDAMGGYDPYSSSKGCSELVTNAYIKSFFNPDKYKEHGKALASVRAGNVIGGGDWAEDRLVPDCIRALTKKETINIRYPKATRPWQHVLEPLSGYLWLGALMWSDKSYSGGWNFGPNDEDILTVEEVVKETIDIWGNGKYKVTKDDEPHEANMLKLDINKAYSVLKWRPVYKGKEALEKTICWYKKYYEENGDGIYNYTLNQIGEYVEAAQECKIEWSTRSK